MKFQIPRLNIFELTDGRTDAHTHARTSPNQYASHFFIKVGGIKIVIFFYFCSKTLIVGKCNREVK